MEDRTLLSTFLVSNTGDSGPGSLRQAILDSNNAVGATNTIDFDISSSGVQTIVPLSSLSAITNPVLIDGTSQPGYSGTPLIEINGSQAGGGAGLTLAGLGVTVRGLVINRLAIDATNDERLVAQVHATGITTRLSLLDAQGRVLVQSDGLSASDPNDVIDEHLTAGTEFLEVQTLSGSGTYSLSTSLTPTSVPYQTLPLPPSFQGGSYAPIAVGDFTNNGILDIVAPDGVYLGTGDGTFQAPSATGALVDPTSSPSAIAVGDFNSNSDHNLDVAVALAGTDSISISLGNGDGTFQPVSTFGLAVAGTPDAIVAGDFGNGQTDLAVAIAGTGGATDDVVVLMGNGDGTFQALAPIPVGLGPVSIAAGDIANHGRLDLAVADINSGDVTILSNQGGGNFSATQTIELPPGSTPTSVVAGDFGTGNIDLAVTDSSTSEVDILKGNGDGTFQPQPVSTIEVGANPSSIVAGDFGNGHLGLATADANANDVSVLLGNGDGTFQTAIHMAAGSTPIALVAGDFNGDGRLDLATGNAGSNDISVLLGKGDGTFDELVANAVGNATSAIATGDFTGNRNLGLAVVNQGSDSVTILPGNGDGTFQRPLTVPLPYGSGASSIVAADFNNDGRTDLAVADPSLNEVSILLGNGDGTFQSSTIAVAGGPYTIVAGDFTGDGQIDLAVANRAFSIVTILLGNGDGTFRVLPPTQLGQPDNPPFPDAIVTGDFNGDGHLDLAAADVGTDAVTVLLGNGDGTFRVLPPISLGAGFPSILSLVAGDFNHDGYTDLAVASTDYFNGDSVDVLLSNGDGTFRVLPPISLGYGVYPAAIVAGDFNDDGKLDLATADANANGTDDYSVYLGNGDGTFQGPTPYPIGGTGVSTALVAGDFNGDGRTDLAITRTYPDDVRVELGRGDGTFADAGQLPITSRYTPLVADVSGNGTDDVLVVDGFGNILDRRGIAGQPNTFELPAVINPGFPSRDIAWVPNTLVGPLLASVDAQDDAVSLYAYQNGSFVRVGSLTTGQLPAQIVAADLSGDGWDDLVVRNAGDGSLSVFFNNGQGSFWTGFNPFRGPVTLSVGPGVSDVQAIDTSGDGHLDLVVTNKVTGQVSVLFNQGNGSFAAPVSYRAGTGLSEIEPGGTPELASLEATAGVAGGPLTQGGPDSLVTINPGSNTFDVLAGLGGGRFANPVTFPTPGPAQIVYMADFTDSGRDDLVLITAVGVSIYLANGKGGFLPPVTYDAGFEPSGLTVADVNHDGTLDLLVGDSNGNVLVFLGQGDGTFQAPGYASEPPVELAADLSDNGSKDIISADQRLDILAADHGGGNLTILADASTGLVDPGAVTLADLNGDGIPDLIVANSGSNNVLIYPGLGNGLFGPAINDGHGYFVGTNPVGITVANLTGNLPDLVVSDDESNTVTILINTSQSTGGISFRPGQRLQTFGFGPVSTVVGDFNGDGVPDLLVTNSQSNDVVLLPGIGNGFFNDQNPTIFSAGNALGQTPVILPVGNTPVTSFVGKFNGQNDLVTVDSGSNALTLISGFEGPNAVTSTIASGGLQPDTAFAFSSASGFENLVVGNAGDGTLALFEGGPDGLSLTSAASDPNLPNPTALAFSALTGGQVQFYAATAGRESAELVALSLGIETAPISSSTPPANSVAQLVPLNESSLPLVATLLTLTISVSGEELNFGLVATEATAVAAFLPGTGISVGQGLSSQRSGGLGGDDGAELDESKAGVAGAVPAAIAPWERYVIGLDEALEKFQRENPNGVSGAPARDTSSDRPESPPAAGLPTQGGPTSLRSGSNPVPSGGEPDQTDNASPSLGVEAIDAIIQSVWGDDRASDSRERLSHTGRPSGRSHDVLPPIRLVDAPSPRSALPLAGSDRWTGEVLPLGPEIGKDQPDLALTSLVVATMATEWVHACRWHRTIRPGWPGKVGNPVRRRRAMIK